ncbi:LysE family translocator [Ponticoccus litoralis]|uniref:LysE family translocator n=1 Tax=Ponticoccus litoralis TaxID=422297 RepID=A0AAW9SAB2_9RHOB
MTQDLFLALALFCFVTVASPGPNNLMLMASGANFGFRRTLPHLAGVVWGLPVMILPVGLGVMQVFTLWPWTQDVLSTLCLAYLLWLAWKIAHAAPPARAEATARPLSLWQAAGFQWVNPKAWTMATGGDHALRRRAGPAVDPLGRGHLCGHRHAYLLGLGADGHRHPAPAGPARAVAVVQPGHGGVAGGLGPAHDAIGPTAPGAPVKGHRALPALPYAAVTEAG